MGMPGLLCAKQSVKRCSAHPPVTVACKGTGPWACCSATTSVVVAGAETDAMGTAALAAALPLGAKLAGAASAEGAQRECLSYVGRVEVV